MSRFRVILLPGGVLPAAVAYSGLLDELDADVQAIAKDLEVYAGERPPDDYGLDREVAAIARTADCGGIRPVRPCRLFRWRCCFIGVRRTTPRLAREPRAAGGCVGGQCG